MAARDSLMRWMRDNQWVVPFILSILAAAFLLNSRVSALETTMTGEVRTHLQAAPVDHDTLLILKSQVETLTRDVAEVKGDVKTILKAVK